MPLCFFVSDLHGHIRRYRILFRKIMQEEPTAVFMGGDLLPLNVVRSDTDLRPIKNFVVDFLIPEMKKLQSSMGDAYPRFFMILGNDDAKTAEADIRQGESERLWEYIHGRRVNYGEFSVFGYAYVPPTPFQLKDWERYDVSRYLEPGCVAPEDGWHTVPIRHNHVQYTTIQGDIQGLIGEDDLSNAIFLFHAPPYQTNLDRAALDGRFIDHIPVDVHVGSIAIRRLVENRQPLLTLHGHIHESTRLTGKWIDRIGGTYSFTAAHDGPELALIRFNPNQLDDATRELIGW